MQTFFIVLILAFGFLITFQIAKASEYVAVLRGEERARKQTNRINAFLLLAFLVTGWIFTKWYFPAHPKIMCPHWFSILELHWVLSG